MTAKTGGEKVPVSQPVLPLSPPPAAASKDDEEPTDGIRFGQYVLLDKIATGGMAEVWKARMKGVEGFQKIVAIKKILPHLSDNQDFIEMFVDEAKLAAQLNHNNIIHIYDLGKIGNSYYIAMEYVDGHDLKTILRRGVERDQPVNVELALFVASKIAAALDYAHRKRDFDEKEMGLVHRDVSPQNVLISQEGDIKLCDFGIAKAASKASHTQAGALKGKLQYMSPEQAWGKNIDRRSDIFALATVLFEMLANRKLFTGENEMSILEQVREARVVPPSQINDEVTPEIDRIVLKALQKDPEDRYQTAGEMARDIDSVLYSFRPTPTSADLAIYMHRIWVEEALASHAVHVEEEASVARPLIENDLAKSAPKRAVAAPVVAPVVAAPAAAAAPAMPAWDAAPAHASSTPKKRSAALPIAAAVVVVLAAAGGYFYFSQRGSAPQTASKTTTQTPAAALPATNTALTATMTTTTSTATAATASAIPVPGTQAPALDPTAVAQEVQKRLAAERARLDEERRAQTATAAPSRPAPAVSTQPPPQTATQQATATVAPPPAPVPEPTATTATQAAVDTAPAAPQYRQGDLVPAGTEGLVMPRITRRGTVPYPPMARAQRVQGTVIMSILVSESGQVLQTRVIRGINRNVGLNEAAEEIMRRSTFSAPTKDGVRVKTWTTERVDFKL
jgi:TonB family protein